MPILRLDQAECWVIHEWVRRDRSAPSYGEEHDLGFVMKLWQAILALAPAGHSQETVEVEFTRSELLQITRQVSAMITVGTHPIGKEVLKKAFVALRDEESEAKHAQIPAVFRDAYQDQDAVGDRAGSGADAEALSG